MEYTDRIYLDNSATTPLLPEVSEEMVRVISEVYGNPSSLHSVGYEAEKTVEKARKSILASIGAGDMKGSLIFTASGTEADNLAIFGTVNSKERNKNKRIITTDSEHPAVYECFKKLGESGYDVVYIKTKDGVIDFDEFESAVSRDTVLVSVMAVNNETGAVNDIKTLSGIVKSKSPDAVFHTDSVQGYMKMPLSVKSIPSDLITLSAHKIGGPKGVGALYVSPEIIKAKKLSPIIFGGGQENSFRSGTENVIGIAGFGVAASVKSARLKEDIVRMAKTREYLVSKLSSLDVNLNIPKSSSVAPNIVNLTLNGIRGETMVHFLSKYGIFVSSGSACSSHSPKPSRALLSFGLCEKQTLHSLRVSLSPDNTFEEIDKFIEKLEEGIGSLARA